MLMKPIQEVFVLDLLGITGFSIVGFRWGDLLAALRSCSPFLECFRVLLRLWLERQIRPQSVRERPPDRVWITHRRLFIDARCRDGRGWLLAACQLPPRRFLAFPIRIGLGAHERLAHLPSSL